MNIDRLTWDIKTNRKTYIMNKKTKRELTVITVSVVVSAIIFLILSNYFDVLSSIWGIIISVFVYTTVGLIIRKQ
ncbi:MAG: hypothetical protein GXY98_02645 [Erysipelothrix sp.]|nr:hypothetical protein [Erysipelothrix sp.]